MQRRELRPKRELLSLLERLNDCVGISARRMYMQQVTCTELLQRPHAETRLLLPELCVFVDSLLPITSTTSNNSIVSPPSSLVRHAFRHPEAQWLSRSARQSGISALLCQQLMRLARQNRDNGSQDHNNAIHWSEAELIIHVLLDALLSSCAQRLGQVPGACRWCPQQHKPRFHAMTCFPVWSTLLPFASLMGIRFPHVFQQVLKERRRSERKTHRVNCDFAVVTGIWRLVEELDRGDKDKQKAVTDVMASLLRFASDRMLLCCKSVSDNKKPVDSHLEDQLLEKFFTGMQKFSFKSWRADKLLKQTLIGTLEEALGLTASGTKIGVVSQRVVVFITAGCMLVKDLAVDIVSMVFKQINGMNTFSGKIHPLLPFLVGFCAHVDLVHLKSVLEVLELLVASYKAVDHTAADPEQQKQRQRELVFYIACVTLLRIKSVDSLRQEVSSNAAAVLELLKQFQMQLCSEIAYGDFQVAAPVQWVAQVWKHWVFLSDEEVQVFVSEAQENDTDTEQEFKKRVATWKAWEARIAFKLSSFSRFPQMKTLVKPHLISTPLTDLNDEIGLIVRARKRRRTEKLPTTNENPEQLDGLFDVLLLPDVMERVCSFISAKRLCRMALVCRDFAELSHRASLWRQLYLRIGSSIGKKLPASPVECHHGDNYKHNWRQMYQERCTVLQRLRRMQRRTIEPGQSSGKNSCETSSSNNRIATFIPLMCTYCGCNHVLKSASEQDVHEAQHKQFTCMELSCKASFTGLHKFNQHMKEHATESIVRSTTTRLVCGYNGCKKSYLSAKRMTTHRQQGNHVDRRKA